MRVLQRHDRRERQYWVSLRKRCAPADPLSPGLLRSGLCGLAITAVLYLVFNAYMNWSITSAYNRARLERVMDAQSSRAAAASLIKAGLADSQLQGWLERHLASPASEMSASQHLLALFKSELKQAPEIDEQRERRLRELVTGRRSGWWRWPLVVDSTPTSGREIYKEVSKVGGADWDEALQHSEHGPEKKECIIRIADELIDDIQPSLRWLRRFNGVIQWVTFAVFFMVAVAVFRRYGLRLQWQQVLEKLRAVTCAPTATNTTAPQEPDDRLEEFEQRLNSRVFQPFEVVSGLLAPLGFIGTVWGMGKALLRADGLLNSADKQRSISDMTSHLGFAFDTTLVALALTILAGAYVAWCRNEELAFLDRVRTSERARQFLDALDGQAAETTE